MTRRARPLSRKPARSPLVREAPEPYSRVGVRELRQNLSVYLERIKRGEVLTVTDHGHDVALLKPLQPATDLVERLAAEGRVRKPTRSLQDLPSPLALRLKKSLSQILIDMRDEERY